MFSIVKISEEEAAQILIEEESHYLDFMQKDYSGEALQKKCVSFANAEGGEVYVGIIDRDANNLKGGKLERWDGFVDQEEANNTISDITDNISPAIQSIIFDFIEVNEYKDLGKVLRVTIEKSDNVHSTASQNIWVRQGARCKRLTDKQAVTDLQLSKGSKSYEDQIIGNYETRRLIDSAELNGFLKYYSPITNPQTYLEKQNLITKNGVAYAGILLYDDNPSTVSPKKCALQIVWYDTDEEEPERVHLKSGETIEGPIHLQINEGVDSISKIINSLSIMGSAGLEKARYPKEAIKEILVNALIHRDYNLPDDVIVKIFNNRIEVTSPGGLPGFITPDNILGKRFSRNTKIERLIHKYSDRPNMNIGEGLNTTFQKMEEVRLKKPIINATSNSVTVILPHEPLASPEEQILEYLANHAEITNEMARSITGIRRENRVKKCFDRLRDKGYIELTPGKRGSSSSWRKTANTDILQDADQHKNDLQTMLF